MNRALRQSRLPVFRLPSIAGMLLATFALLGENTIAMAQAAPNICGELGNAFGPFDYRTERNNNLHLVESAHFTPEVEVLIKGHTSTTPGPDLDYVLRAFPNHHRALLATIRLSEKEKTSQPRGMRFDVACWLDRAIRFRPDDLTARMIYAGYLAKNGRKPEALQHLAYSELKAGDNAFTQYNLGLVYLDMGEFEAALRQAYRAEDLGFPRDDLRSALTKAGKWVDRVASIVPGASAPISTASQASR